MAKAQNIKQRLEFLAGSQAPLQDDQLNYWKHLCARVGNLDNISYDELNQLLVAVGFNRISEGFFEFLFESKTQPRRSFDESLSTWRKLAMLNYGNFRHAYRVNCRRQYDDLSRDLVPTHVDYSTRPVFGAGLQRIDRIDTPLLGYTLDDKTRLLEAKTHRTESEENDLSRITRARTRGMHNTYEYCSGEYMDVYVATSMRSPEEFYAVNRFTEDLFDATVNNPLNQVAFFDPTQSYLDDRIAKGVVEALMLKRASVTIYLSQETDTLGKDSELASTLAQGKTVLAYVPRVDDEATFAVAIDKDLSIAVEDLSPDKDAESEKAIHLAHRMVKVFPDKAHQAGYMDGISPGLEYERALSEYASWLVSLYDDRARTYQSKHPLALQVSLGSGVANGIIVVRTIDQARQTLSEALSGTLEYKIEAARGADDLSAPLAQDRFLRESSTDSIARVVIGDQLISNAFWNWYGQI